MAFARALLPPPCAAPPDGDARGDIRVGLGLEDKIVLGFSGFVRAGIGLEWAIRALRRLSPEVHLLVIGEGPARDDLEDQAAFLGVADRAHFVGRVPPEAIAGFVQCFDIALQTRSAGFAAPLKIFEHVSAGCAFLTPDQPNRPQSSTPGVDALFFDPQNEASFFSALRQLCTDAGLRARLGAIPARPSEPEPFNWTENTRRLEDLARGLLALGGHAAGRSNGPASI
jgi:glycosyltransferase involved in cell wall biosynthesis